MTTLLTLHCHLVAADSCWSSMLRSPARRSTSSPRPPRRPSSQPSPGSRGTYCPPPGLHSKEDVEQEEEKECTLTRSQNSQRNKQETKKRNISVRWPGQGVAPEDVGGLVGLPGVPVDRLLPPHHLPGGAAPAGPASPPPPPRLLSQMTSSSPCFPPPLSPEAPP